MVNVYIHIQHSGMEVEQLKNGNDKVIDVTKPCRVIVIASRWLQTCIPKDLPPSMQFKLAFFLQLLKPLISMSGIVSVSVTLLNTFS